MTAKTVKFFGRPDARRLVVFIVYPDIVLLDLVGPLQVFSHALDSSTGQNGYDCVVTSVEGGLIPTNTVVPCQSVPVSSLAGRDIHCLVVVGGDGAIPGMRKRDLVEAVTALAAAAQRVCSVCSGSLVLAATGLLDGRRAVTHWDDCKMLEEAFPRVQVELDPIYIQGRPDLDFGRNHGRDRYGIGHRFPRPWAVGGDERGKIYGRADGTVGRAVPVQPRPKSPVARQQWAI